MSTALIKPNGLPAFDSSQSLAQGMLFYGVDTGTGSIIDVAGGNSTVGVGLPASTSTSFGSGLYWDNANLVDSGYYANVTPTMQSALDLADAPAGAGFTIGCTFVQLGPVATNVEGLIFGRPAHAAETSPLWNEAFTTGHSDHTVELVLNNGGQAVDVGEFDFGAYGNLVTVVATVQNISNGTAIAKFFASINGEPPTLVATAPVSAGSTYGFGHDEENQIMFGDVYHVITNRNYNSFNGTVFTGFIAGRAWTDTEVTGYAEQPYSLLDWTLPPSLASATDHASTFGQGGYTNDQQVALLVTLENTGAAAGDSIQLYNGDGLSAPIGAAYVLTAADISNGFATVETGALTPDTTYQIAARIVDQTGTPGRASDLFGITVDPSDPNPIAWATSTSGTWQTGSNWTPSEVPGQQNSVFIEKSGSYTVSNGTDATIDRIALAEGASLDLTGGTFTLLDGTALGGVAGSIEVEATATFIASGAVSLQSSGNISLRSGATFDLISASLTGGTISNAGSIDVSGASGFDSSAITNMSGGVVNIETGSTLDISNSTITGGAISINGSIVADGTMPTVLNGVTVSNGNLTVSEGAALDGSSATFTNLALHNDALIDFTGPNTLDAVGLDNANGKAVVDGSSKLTLKNTTIQGGTLDIESALVVDGSGASTFDNVTITNGTTTGQTASALSLDGSGYVSLPFVPSTAATVSLTTTHANDVIVVDVVENSTTVASVTDTAGLTWHLRAVGGNSGDPIYEYYAIAPTALTDDNIRVSFAGTASYVDLNAFGVSGVNPSSPFDTNASLPAAGTGPALASTDSTNDLILASYRFSLDQSPTAGPGWTAINPTGGYYLSEYQITSSSQSALPAAASTSDQNGAIVDAFVPASGSGSQAAMTVSAGASLDLEGATISGGTISNLGTTRITGTGQITTLNNVNLINRSVAAGSSQALAIDGNGFTNLPFEPSAAASVKLTTSNTNDVIIVDVVENSTAVASIADSAGLAWHQRAVAGSSSYPIYEYYAIAPSALTNDQITAFFSGTASYADINAFGISGADTSAPFDASVAAPSTLAPSTGSISTGNTNDLIFAGYRFASNGTPTAGNSWTAINASGGYYLSEYKVVSTAQNGLSAPASSSDQNGGIIDAVVQAPMPTGATTTVVDNGSTLDLDSSVVTGGTLDNSGIVEVVGNAGSTLNGVAVSNGVATIIVDAGSTLTLEASSVAGGTLNNAGTVDVTAPGATLLNGVSLSNTSAAIVVESGAALDLYDTAIAGGNLSNAGTVKSTGSTELNGVGVTNAGLLEVVAGTLTLDPTFMTNTGTVLATGGATLDLENITISNSAVLGPALPLALDGTGFTSLPFQSSTAATVQLTTSRANDIIIVDIIQNGTSVASVADSAGLAWQQRALAGTSGQTIEEYYAVAPTALTNDSITVKFAGTASYADVNAFGVSGADITDPFDISAPATAATGPASISTPNAGDLIISSSRFANDATPTPGANWSAISAGGGYYLSEYQIVSSTGQNSAATASTADQNGSILDALKQAGPTNTSGAVAVDAGSVLDLNASSISGGTLTNAGTVNSSGTTLLDGTVIANSGLLEATSGTLTVKGAVSNSGELFANGAALDITGAITGSGAAEIGGNNAVLELGGAFGQKTTFDAGAIGQLKLDDAEDFSGTVAGLASGDSVDLANFQFSGNPMISQVTGTGAAGTSTNITIQDGALTATIALLNQYANQFAVDQKAYSLSADSPGQANSGTALQLAVAHA